MNPHFYLDANVLVALLTSEPKSKSVKQALDVIMELKGGALFASQFAFIEVAKVLVNTKKKSPKDTQKLIKKAVDDRSVAGYTFELLPASPSPTYTFDEFFEDVGINMNLYNPGWGDAFHIVIMKNNRLENILSTDAKDDFEIVHGLNLFHPESLVGED